MGAAAGKRGDGRQCPLRPEAAEEAAQEHELYRGFLVELCAYLRGGIAAQRLTDGRAEKLWLQLSSNAAGCRLSWAAERGGEGTSMCGESPEKVLLRRWPDSTDTDEQTLEVCFACGVAEQLLIPDAADCEALAVVLRDCCGCAVTWASPMPLSPEEVFPYRLTPAEQHYCTLLHVHPVELLNATAAVLRLPSDRCVTAWCARKRVGMDLFRLPELFEFLTEQGYLKTGPAPSPRRGASATAWPMQVVWLSESAAEAAEGAEQRLAHRGQPSSPTHGAISPTDEQRLVD